jgi:regulatory protein
MRQAAERRNRASGGERPLLGNPVPRPKASRGLNIEPDSPDELKARALRHLVRREHSRAELARKLAPHAASPEILEGTLDWLESTKRLSNQRFAEVRARVLARKYGAARIRHDLKSKGIGDEMSRRAVAELNEVERARQILARKFRQAATTREERAKRARFLQNRGFSYDAIYQAVRIAADE